MLQYNEDKILKILDSKGEVAAKKYMSNFIPDVLSKFFSFTVDDEKLNESKIETFKDDSLWFDYAKKQNDPAEFRTIIFPEKQFDNEFLKRENDFCKNFLEEVINKLLLCCFTSNNFQNKKMWEDYANNFNGYCIEYEIIRKEIFFQVHYQDNKFDCPKIFEPYFLSCNKLLEKQKNIEEHNHYEKIQNKLIYFFTILFSLKETKWKEENEYRIISVHFDKYEHKVPISFLGLKPRNILIGYNCSENNKNKLIEISKQKDLKCYQLLKTGEELSRKLIR